MAFQKEVYIVDGGDRTIKVAHTFYGYSEQEVEHYMREHLSSCSYFRSAEQQDRVIELDPEEIPDDELPQPADFAKDGEEAS